MAVMPFVGDSREEALELRDRHNALVDPQVGLSTLASHTDFDFATLPLDAPVEEREVGGMQGAFRLVRQLSLEGLTLAEIGRRYGQSVLVPQLAGTATDITDALSALFEAQAADGFVISPAHLPHGFDAFVDRVVPELQRRGLYRDRYRGGTLRDRLRDA
jgi:alkanesulfonate monooxygenase SsuD/methylene tetrahydromethanopterin reductase-like flavin-dependent oxidoreductase (luciferase family)